MIVNVHPARIAESAIDFSSQKKQQKWSLRQTYDRFSIIPEKDLPTVMDLDFSNFCNLQCIMCDPHYSSRLMTEQEKVFDLLKQEEFSNNNLYSWYKNSNTVWNRSDAQKYTWPTNNKIFDQITSQMAESNCRKVYVNGGEPTLHNYYVK